MENITSTSSEFHLPRFHEIPDVGLFLEQTVRLINSYLSPFGDFELTNSMVSNYVKQKLIAPPVKKLYHREQIARLIFIAMAKSILSLEHIQQFFALQIDQYPPEKAYDYFCAEFENILQYILCNKASIEQLGTTNSSLKDWLRNMIFIVLYKTYLINYLRGFQQ